MNAVDTSVVVAAFGSWHERHEACLRVVQEHPRVPAHALLEAYSVLTRLPAPHRAPPAIARDFLSSSFSGAVIQLEADAVLGLIADLPSLGIAGGATYDALIGATARAAEATIVSCDRRALVIYQQLGLRVQFIE